MKYYTRLLTIAGSDSGGGAGIQADLKTFSALECYGMSAITALTAQNTQGVTNIYPVDSVFLAEQIDAIMEDIGVDAIKIGMLNDQKIIQVVGDKLEQYKVANVVLDPVMVSKSGHKLLEDKAIDSLKEKLLPLTHILTPNIPEAEHLTEEKIPDENHFEYACEKICYKGTENVLLKGGHLNSNNIVDLFYNCDKKELLRLENNSIHTKNRHGTGCTLSSAIAAYLAKGYTAKDAVLKGKEYLVNAMYYGKEFQLGNGYGPVCHFYANWNN